MITSIVAEKAFEKIQHPFVIQKTFTKVVIERTYLNIIKVHSQYNREKLKAFLLNSGTRQGYPLSHLFNIDLEVLATSIREEKELTFRNWLHFCILTMMYQKRNVKKYLLKYTPKK